MNYSKTTGMEIRFNFHISFISEKCLEKQSQYMKEDHLLFFHFNKARDKTYQEPDLIFGQLYKI